MTGTVAGAMLTGCAVLVGIGASVPGRQDDGRTAWYWPSWFWAMAAGLAVAGLVLAVRPGRLRPTAAVAAVLAAQLAGRSIVGVRDWYNVNGGGFVAMTDAELLTRATLAAGMAMAGVLAAAVAVALLWREPARGRAAWRPRRPGLAVAGAVLAVLPPASIVVAGGSVTEAGSGALISFLPWGGGLVAAAWLGPRARRAVLGAVLACVLLTVAGVGVCSLWTWVTGVAWMPY